ncbi:MAG: flavodoxin [Bacilli bacterium]|nr:flavodoxin [Bacilli bacterium]
MKKVNKNIFIFVLVIFVVCLLFFLLLNNKDTSKVKKDIKTNSNTNNSNSLVLYFSVTKNTKAIAEYIQETTGSDIIEIVPADKYSNADINYSNQDSRATKEQKNDKARPKISNKIDIKDYDVIYLGYPIWWNDVPKIILTLLDSYNFENKVIVPFCTSGSSDISNSVDTLRKYNNKLNILDGKRFSASSSEDDVKNWLSSLNIEFVIK